MRNKVGPRILPRITDILNVLMVDRTPLKEECHKIFGVLFWHAWIDLGLYKNL
jgi:hypothetical protein